MKINVIGLILTLLIFLVLSALSINAHASTVHGLDGVWVCGNTGISATIVTEDEPTTIDNKITNFTQIILSDEGSNVLFIGSVYRMQANKTASESSAYFSSDNKQYVQVEYKAPNGVSIDLYTSFGKDWTKTDTSLFCTM